MGNHVHLLISTEKAGALSKAMRHIGQNYVSTFNRRHRRTGTWWEGRFKSCLVDSDRYLLTVYRYIELNPVRAAMVEMPEHYPWSSVRANLALLNDPIVTPHAAFLAMAPDRTQRAEAYRMWLRAGINDDELVVSASTSNKSGRWEVLDFRRWQRKHWDDPSSYGSKGDRDANMRMKAKPITQLNYLRSLFRVPFSGSPFFRGSFIFPFA
jgi:hypothetical protein